MFLMVAYVQVRYIMFLSGAMEGRRLWMNSCDLSASLSLFVSLFIVAIRVARSNAKTLQVDVADISIETVDARSVVIAPTDLQPANVLKLVSSNPLHSKHVSCRYVIKTSPQ